METKLDFLEYAATQIVHHPTTKLTKQGLFGVDSDAKMFDYIYPNFNGFLMELLSKINLTVMASIDKHLSDITINPLTRIHNLYQMYIDEFVNQNLTVYNSTHLKTVSYSGNDEVRDFALSIIQNIKNAHINCINEARRQNKINVDDSEPIVDFILLSWDGALFQQEHTQSIKPLFIFYGVLKNVLLK
jgi:hypothetical protein